MNSIIRKSPTALAIGALVLASLPALPARAAEMQPPDTRVDHGAPSPKPEPLPPRPDPIPKPHPGPEPPPPPPDAR